MSNKKKNNKVKNAVVKDEVKEIKKNDVQPQKAEVKAEVKKEVKAEVKKDAKKEVKKDPKKDIDVKKEVKVEPKNDVAKEDVKVLEDVDNKPISTKELEKRLKRGSNDKVVIMSIVIGALVLAFALFGFYFYKTNMQAVVTFDGGKITKAEYTLYYKRYSKMLEQYGYPATMIPEYIANISASDKILLAEAKAAGITISDENKKSVEEMFAKKEEVQAMKDGGMDPVAMKSLYYDQYVILQYIDKIGADASDEEILNYIKSKADKDAVIDMNQYSTRHILIKTSDATGSPLPEADLTKAKTKAESALARVKASEDFATVAKELSEDTGTKDDGGKFVMYMDGKVLPEYTEAVKKLQAGQITDTLIKTDAGYHIIKLDSIDANMRTKSKGEREAFANEKVDKIGETKNVNVNTDELNKLIESITGKKVEVAPKEEAPKTDGNVTPDPNATVNTPTPEPAK